jgi:hypothetical protein
MSNLRRNNFNKYIILRAIIIIYHFYSVSKIYGTQSAIIGFEDSIFIANQY